MRLFNTLCLLVGFVMWPAFSQTPPTPSCNTEAHRQFDFWLGEWEVWTPTGQLAGVNKISLAYGGCVLHEQYTTGRGYSGGSFNMYDASRGQWHQTWVDNTGMLLQLSGGMVNGNMVLTGETVDATGIKRAQRITWTKQSDGAVQQRWETTTAQGQWQTVFDGKYTKLAAK